MPATPVTNFRLSLKDLGLLDALCDDSGGVSRTQAIRRLIRDEATRRNLTAGPGIEFIERLRQLHGDEAVLSLRLEGTTVVGAMIGEDEATGLTPVLVHDTDKRAELRLDDPEGPASLLLLELDWLRPGQTVTYEVPLADLSPEMNR